MTSPFENQNLSLIQQALEFLIKTECYELASCLEQLNCMPTIEEVTDAETYRTWVIQSNEIYECLNRIKTVQELLAKRHEILKIDFSKIDETNLSMSVEEANISTKTCNILHSACIYTIYDIIKAGPHNIIVLPNLSRRAFDEICQILIEKFGQNPNEWNYNNTCHY